MSDAITVGDASSWISKPERTPQRLTKAEKEQLRQAQVSRSAAELSTRTGIETAGMQAQALDTLTSFAIGSITDRTMQANREAETSGLADNLDYRVNVGIVLRGLAMGYGRIGNRITGNSW